MYSVPGGYQTYQSMIIPTLRAFTLPAGRITSRRPAHVSIRRLSTTCSRVRLRSVAVSAVRHVRCMATREGGAPEGEGESVSKTARRVWGFAWPLLAFWLANRQQPVGAVEVRKSDAEWRGLLAPEAYHVLRERSTERAGTSPLNYEKRAGDFRCAGCSNPLFDSGTKFESGTGWPSFFDALPGAVDLTIQPLYCLGDLSAREVRCHKCGGHLGHVFGDGPRPTGKRYCMNGVALSFVARGGVGGGQGRAAEQQ